MMTYAWLTATKIHKSIQKRRQTCAVFRMPSGRHRIYGIKDTEYQRMMREYGSCLVGLYTQECNPLWIAEDLSA